MKSRVVNEMQIDTDGKTVWVNGSDGCCLGRFGPRGVDIHKDAAGQMESGSQCLACFERTDDPFADWLAFVDLMATHHGATVPLELIPSQR